MGHALLLRNGEQFVYHTQPQLANITMCTQTQMFEFMSESVLHFSDSTLISPFVYGALIEALQQISTLSAVDPRHIHEPRRWFLNTITALRCVFARNRERYRS